MRELLWCRPRRLLRPWCRARVVRGVIRASAAVAGDAWPSTERTRPENLGSRIRRGRMLRCDDALRRDVLFDPALQRRAHAALGIAVAGRRLTELCEARPPRFANGPRSASVAFMMAASFRFVSAASRSKWNRVWSHAGSSCTQLARNSVMYPTSGLLPGVVPKCSPLQRALFRHSDRSMVAAAARLEWPVLGRWK